MKKSLLGLVLFCLSMVSMTAPLYAIDKIILTPTSTILSETQSTTVQVQLAEPIAGPGSSFLDVNLTSSDPSRVSITPNPVEYTGVDWFQTKTFTVTALDDGVHNTSSNVTISFLVNSNSEFYNLYTGSFVLSITDINPAPVVQTAATIPTPTAVATLADTGQNTEIVQAISIIMLMTCGLVIKRLRQYS